MSTNRIIKTELRVIFILIMLMVFTVGGVKADSNSGQTAATFLKIGFGARSAGMGDAFSSIATGADAVFWNPAGLTHSEQNEVVFSHFSWYEQISIEQGAAAFKINDDFTVGAMLVFVNYGQVDGYDNNGVFTNELALNDWAAGIGVGYTINDEFSVGLTGKFVSQKLDDVTGNAFAFDLGGKYTHAKFGLAASFANIGSDIKFDSESEKLPALFRFGANMHHFQEMLITSLDVEKQFKGDMVVKQGFEFVYDTKYFLRTGFNYFPNQDSQFSTSFSFGGGFNVNNLKVDYSFTPTDQYTEGSLHRFSFNFAFGK